jgi:gluconokinase
MHLVQSSDSANTTEHPDRAKWVVVMGVAGCGKSTLAQQVAGATHLPFIEGDDFHAAENKRKMTAGIALDDADRQGWLDILAEEMRIRPGGAILSCSALKRVYRDRLRTALPGLRFIYIKITQDMAISRVAARATAHFFPASVVASQFAALEDPVGEQRVLQLDGSLTPSELLVRSMDWIGGKDAAAVTV